MAMPIVSAILRIFWKSAVPCFGDKSLSRS